MTGRHDLPFLLQRGSRNATQFSRRLSQENDRAGWSEENKIAAVGLIIIVFNDAEKEKSYTHGGKRWGGQLREQNIPNSVLRRNYPLCVMSMELNNKKG